MDRGVLLRAAALACVALAALAPAVSAQRGQTPGYAWDEEGWRFRAHDRRVKVVLLAGSIGAYRDQPYGRLLHQWCEDAEVRNISVVGAGVPQLVQHFRRQVLENPHVPIGAPNHEVWLLFGGGMNSVGLPHRSARAMRQLFQLAHRRGIRVVGMTLTPWGTDGDDDPRWEGARALQALRSTRHIVDFVRGRLPPEEALGSFLGERSDPSAPWSRAERPDVVVDLYDSPLRDRDARPWPTEQLERALRHDPYWRRTVEDVPEAEREARLEADARELAEAPRWFMRREYRAFDHIHPNRDGHEVIARTACPRLPESWGCRCPR